MRLTWEDTSLLSCYGTGMDSHGNIIIGDQTALHFLLHSDMADRIDENRSVVNPLHSCATTLEDLRAFNHENPLYGEGPATLLVPDEASRKKARDIVCRFTQQDLAPGSFFMLRPGLYMTSPELTFVRMSKFVNRNQLAEIGMNLCGRYFINVETRELPDRSKALTTPERLAAYVKQTGARGSEKCLDALRFVVANSKSPYETKAKLQFCHPFRFGGMGLPFSAMNYDVKAGRLRRMTEQSEYSVDIADPDRHVGLEYDGEDFHSDKGKDKRRLNELKALGWDVFPIDKYVLMNPDATARTGEQIARFMGVRWQRPKTWAKQFMQLRKDLGLPI